MLAKATEELYSSFKGAIEERISSPLIGSFTISWLIINYKVILFFFSKDDLNTKITWFNFYFCTSSYWLLVYAPLIASLTYIFIYPFASNIVTRYLTWHKIQIQRIITRYEGRQLVTEERLETIKKRHYDEKAVLKSRIAGLESIEDELTLKVKSLEELIAASKQPLPDEVDEQDRVDPAASIPHPPSLTPDVFSGNYEILAEIIEKDPTFKNVGTKIRKFSENYGSKLKLAYPHFVLLAALAHYENSGKDYVLDKDLFKTAHFSIINGRSYLKYLHNDFVSSFDGNSGAMVSLTDKGRSLYMQMVSTV